MDEMWYQIVEEARMRLSNSTAANITDAVSLASQDFIFESDLDKVRFENRLREKLEEHR